MTLEEIIPAFFLLALGAWAVTLPLSMFWSIRQKSKLKPKPLYHRLYLRSLSIGSAGLGGFLICGGLPGLFVGLGAGGACTWAVKTFKEKAKNR